MLLLTDSPLLVVAPPTTERRTPPSTPRTPESQLPKNPSIDVELAAEKLAVMGAKAKESEASPLKLLVGVAGIFGAFMYYGQLQGDIVRYKDADGAKLEREWFIQVLEASANVAVGLAGLVLSQGGPSPGIPLASFFVTGSTQVLAKAMTQKAQIFGVPFFVATLVKNAKMVPVMLGAIALSGTRYPVRKWCQVGMIIGGVVLVTVGKSKAPSSAAKSDTENLGLLCLALSLTCDGITGGQQTAFKAAYKKKHGKGLQSYDLMLFTNFAMLCIAVAASLALDQLFSGAAFLAANPPLMTAAAKFAFCSAIGQSAIFFTMANFDPLVTTTVTTTRKIFSVLLDIVSRGHVLNPTQWSGVALASLGVAAELQEKFGGKKGHGKKT